MQEGFKTHLSKILRPIIAFALRYGISVQDFYDLTRALYVDLAAEEISKRGQKVNSSRISAMTGIRRPEVKMFVEGKDPILTTSVLSRVLAQWENDSRFHIKSGKPRALSFGEEGAEFNDLVFSVSRDLHPSSLLFEIQRLNLVEIKNNKLVLKNRRYVVTQDVNQAFSILADDIEQVTQAVEKNVLENQEIKNLHAKTCYDNIYHEDLDTIKTWLLSEGTKFHNKVRNYLSKFDMNIKIQKNKTPGASVTFCTFSNTKVKQKE